MPYYEEKDGQVIPYSGEIPQEAIFAIERADDDAIIQTFSGGFAQEHLMYSYPITTKVGKKMIVGIGVQGANEIAKLLGNIEVLPDVRVQEKDNYFYGVVRAKDIIRNVTLAGFGRQSIFIQTEGMQPTDRNDEHAYVKALTKGQRNAILAISPQEAVVKIVQQFMEQKKLGRLAPPNTKLPTSTAEQKQDTGKGKGKKEGTDELNKAKAAFMMKWSSFKSLMGWNEEKSENMRKEFLTKNFKKASLTELTKEEMIKGIDVIEASITANQQSGEGGTQTRWNAGEKTEEPAAVKEPKAETTPEKTKHEELANVDEKRKVAQALSVIGYDRDKIRATIHEVTGKQKDWTDSDLKKVWDFIDKEKAEKPKEEKTKDDQAAEDFLKGV